MTRKNHFAERLERAAQWKQRLQEQEQQDHEESEDRWQRTKRIWDLIEKQMDDRK